MTDPPERGVEYRGCLRRERFFLAALEQHPELIVPPLVERAMHLGVAPPRLQLARQPPIVRRILQRFLVGLNREVGLAFVVRDLPQQPRRDEQTRVQVERALQARHRVAMFSLRVGGRAGAQQQHRIVRPDREGFGKQRRRAVGVAVAKRLPARVVQLDGG